MAVLLLIDTATAAGHVGLSVNGSLQEQFIAAPFKHAEQLTLAIDGLMRAAELPYSALDAVVITGGPGSYTGLRIGAATAKGICFGSGCALIALNTLDVMVMGYRQAAGADAQGLLVPMLDARRMEVFCEVADAQGELLQSPAAVVLDEQSFARFSTERLHFFGDGAMKYAPLFSGDGQFSEEMHLGAAAMLPLAEKAFSLGKFESVAYYRPDYHKDFYTPLAK